MAFQLNKTFTAENSNKGVEFEYVNPATGKATGAFVTMRGFESKAYRDYQTEKTRNELSKKSKINSRSTDDEPKTAEELHAEAIDMYVALFVGWRGFTDENGEEIPPSHDVVWSAFNQSEPLRSQALAAITGTASFLPSA